MTHFVNKDMRERLRHTDPMELVRGSTSRDDDLELEEPERVGYVVAVPNPFGGKTVQGHRHVWSSVWRVHPKELLRRERMVPIGKPLGDDVGGAIARGGG